jgi:hypothetical protein
VWEGYILGIHSFTLKTSKSFKQQQAISHFPEKERGKKGVLDLGGEEM